MFSVVLVFASAVIVTTECLLSEVKPEENPEDVSDQVGEYGDKYEGDIVLNDEQKIEFDDVLRNGIHDVAKRWPNNTVIYKIMNKHFDSKQRTMLSQAMQEISKKTCIKFTVMKSKQHAVTIKGDDKGCYSTIGYWLPNPSKISQFVNLNSKDPKCWKVGAIMHELLHCLGFFHMQSINNRDRYIKVIWENIKHGKEYEFKKLNKAQISDFGVPYDYDSIMHYGAFAFSKNGRATIEPLKKNAEVGQRDHLSANDVIKINKMYCE